MKSKPLHDREYQIVAQLLREIRSECGITQAELAERLGTDQSLVSKVERQERRIDIAELKRVCDALGVRLQEFVERFEAALRKSTGRRTST